MLSVLISRWKSDERRYKSARGNIDVPKVIHSWLTDARLRSSLSTIVAPQRRELLSHVGDYVFENDAGNVVKEILSNMSLVTAIWDKDAQRCMTRQHLRYLFSTISDSVDFAESAGQLPEEVTYRGVEFLEAGLHSGRGVLLASVYQSHPGYALLHPALKKVAVAVVRRAASKSDYSTTLDGLPSNIFGVPATPYTALTICKSLESGNIVAAYCDFVYRGSGTIKSPLFGYWVPISRALLKICGKTRTNVIPLSILRHGAGGKSKVIVEFFPPLELSGDINALAVKLGVAVECLIRLGPSQWRLWNTLRDRVQQYACAS